MAEVRLVDIEKKYGNFLAVPKQSLTIHDGEFLVLLGPSGCGKTTTMRMIAGLEDITSGDIMIKGERINDKPPKDRDIAMVFQNYGLYPHMTVRQNIEYPLKLRGMPKAQRKERVQETAEKVELDALAGFIGSPSMNLIDGTVRGGVFKAAGVEIPVDLPDRDGVVLGIRPEELDITQDGGAAIGGKLYALELTGESTLVTLRNGASSVCARGHADFEADIDSPCYLAPKEGARIHLFDRASGERLG